jgi:hypothetical protein
VQRHECRDSNQEQWRRCRQTDPSSAQFGSPPLVPRHASRSELADWGECKASHFELGLAGRRHFVTVT